MLSSFSTVDEFGVPKAPLPTGGKYAFHGSKQREALTAGGTVAMGVRLYVPGNGRFLQVDPVLGGTANPYEYPSDPVNEADLSGRCPWCVVAVIAVRAAAYYAKRAATRATIMVSKPAAKKAYNGAKFLYNLYGKYKGSH